MPRKDKNIQLVLTIVRKHAQTQ